MVGRCFRNESNLRCFITITVLDKTTIVALKDSVLYKILNPGQLQRVGKQNLIDHAAEGDLISIAKFTAQRRDPEKTGGFAAEGHNENLQCGREIV